MSRFFTERHKNLVPYVPGEQPKDMKYIKLNTNEAPFPPHSACVAAAKQASETLNLYSDPECTALTKKLACLYNISPNKILFTNGSDEILNFAFMAFCDSAHPAVFPDITYGFYKVFAEINNIPYSEIPLEEDFTVNPDDYIGINRNIFLANPNAPTGIALGTDTLEKIISSNPNNIVVIDEAYIDFGGESCVRLTEKYSNLIVTQTFSKSRSLAGARLGFAIASPELICDLNTIKYSTNPYNVNSMTMAAGLAALENDEYTRKNCAVISENREYTAAELKKLGFLLTKSSANFVFCRHPNISGDKIYRYLKENGILVRHFTNERICEYNRITIGTRPQMTQLINTLKGLINS